MRAQSLGRFCSRSFNSAARAVVLVDKAPENTIPTTTAWPALPDDGQCANVGCPPSSTYLTCLTEDQDPLNYTVPYYPKTPPTPSVTYNLDMDVIVNATGHKLFVMNDSPFQGDYNHPILRLAHRKNSSQPYNPKWNVVEFGTNSSIRVNIWNNNSSPHVRLLRHPIDRSC